MLDFTSALYLGLHHATHSLRPWARFTTGAPAALFESGESRMLASALANLMGCEAATLAPSTLHLAWDLFWQLAEKPITIFMDEEVYPIARWGVQQAKLRHADVRLFAHRDPAHIERELATVDARGTMPVIVTDGFCPECSRVAPLNRYLEIARRHHGLVVADDTQALGVLGYHPSVQMPYGLGGGGAPRWCPSLGRELVVFSSLAKAFGVPLAVLGGSREQIGNFKENSLTRVHCSPPSHATLRAAQHALAVNHQCGDLLRQRLVSIVREFRRGLKAAGLTVQGGHFPMQTLVLPPSIDAVDFHEQLKARGLQAILRRSRDVNRPAISLLFTAGHSRRSVRRAMTIIVEALHATARRSAVDAHSRRNNRRLLAQITTSTKTKETYE